MPETKYESECVFQQRTSAVVPQVITARGILVCVQRIPDIRTISSVSLSPCIPGTRVRCRVARGPPAGFLQAAGRTKKFAGP